MTGVPTAQSFHRKSQWAGPAMICTLDYDARFLRRKRLATDCGVAFLVDLPQTTSLDAGDTLLLSDGRRVLIHAAEEKLLEVRGDLPRLAWHIGNRHTPCQVESSRLLIQCDPVIAHMLEHLGATVREVHEAFTPEGGAYGQGRTHSHEHGHTAHAH